MGEAWIPYCGAAPLPAEWLAHWNLDPVLLAALILAAWAMWRVRSTPALAGIALLALLFVSPLCALSSALLSVRIGHHIVLAGIAAPLLAAALPRVPGNIVLWTGLHALAFWLWHAPQPYAAALSDDVLFWLMQLSLLATAVGLWSAVRTASPPAAVAGLLATMVQMGLLGALLTFAAAALYAPHAATTLAWGLAPIEDQQLAGLLLWAPGSALYLAAALAIGWRALGGQREAVAR